MSDEKITRVITSHLEPISIRLLRDKEGKYRWEIEVHTDNKEEAIGLLKSLDKMLREKFIEESKAGYVGRATDISEPSVAKEKEEKKIYTIANIRRYGITYARATIFENTIYINPSFDNIKINDKAINFLKNSLKSFAEKENFDFQIIEDNGILKKIVIKGKVSEDTMKNIFGKIAWAFEKAVEKPIEKEEKEGEENGSKNR